jgi:AcrR family transcriptional regulator
VDLAAAPPLGLQGPQDPAFEQGLPRTSAGGEASRQRILDAAAEIARERGYEGTSINRVSERSGLPASSIYWHFKDKDQLIAAVIDRSFTAWVEALTIVPDLPVDVSAERAFVEGLRNAGEQLDQFPDFLRLGLMLILEHRPEEPAARRRFHQARTESLTRVHELYRLFFGGLDDDQLRRLARFTLAGSDGLFIAANEGELELAEEFELLAHAVLGAARSLGWVSPA